MACGKPPNPNQMTPPEDVRHPIIPPARQCMREVLIAIRNLRPGQEFDRQMKRAQNWFDRVAATNGVDHTTLARLAGQLQQVKSEATRLLREIGAGQSVPFANADGPEPLELPKNWSARPVATVICDALTNPNHLLHDKTTERLMTFVGANREISQNYREQLPLDIAEILKHTPDALGLVKEAVHRGQKHPLASPGKIGNGTGTVYEIMGTAALIRKNSIASNTNGLPLHITPLDRFDFGIKLPARYLDEERVLFQNRKTIEADILICRPPPQPNMLLEPYREIAVDFKHAKDGKGHSDKEGAKKTKEGTSALATQLAGVVNALRTDDIHEFHFVTNGHFSRGFKEAVERTNLELVALECQPISLHEHVIADVCKPKLPFVGVNV